MNDKDGYSVISLIFKNEKKSTGTRIQRKKLLLCFMVASKVFSKTCNLNAFV